MGWSVFVERTFLRVWSMWPIAVAGYLGRYLLTTSVVRPVQDWEKSFLIALIHVVIEGLNSAE